MNEQIKVAVGVLTYRRPDMLASLLPLLREQLAGLPQWATGRIIVVDNDPEQSAREVATAADIVFYAPEPTPGIAAARYRCLSEADSDDLLQFVDDDEEPGSGWLATMVTTWDAWGRPAAVAGGVLPRYEVPPSAFIRAGGFFDRNRYPTGTRLPAAPTGNLLIDVGQARRLGVRFDRDLGLRGGEDTLFTRQLVARGGRIIFCDDAPVTDLVPADRATRGWVLRRAYHHGGTHVFTTLHGVTGRRRRLLQVRCFGGGAGRALVGLLKVGAGLITRSLRTRATGWRLAYRGSGMMIEALWGTRPEYTRK